MRAEMSGERFPRIYREKLRAKMCARISAAIQRRRDPD
jgi:hypothetical protein